MSQIVEFREIAERHGAASLDTHMKNYFHETGQPAVFAKVRSLRSQVLAELRAGGRLRKLVENGIIYATDHVAGKEAEWQVGLPVRQAEYVVMNYVMSDTERRVHALTNVLDYQMPDTIPAIEGTVKRMQTLSLRAQDEIGAGLLQVDYERRLKAEGERIRAEESSKREAERARQDAKNDRIIDTLLSLVDSGASRAVTTRRRDTEVPPVPPNGNGGRRSTTDTH